MTKPQECKNFYIWSIDKDEINKKKISENFYPKVREIFYIKLGINIGTESDGKKKFIRPAIILSKIGSLYWIIPLTSKFKNNIFHHLLYSIKFKNNIFHHLLYSIKFKNIKNSLAMLSQGRVIDKKRIISKLGKINNKEFKEIQKKMKKLYFPSF